MYSNEVYGKESRVQLKVYSVKELTEEIRKVLVEKFDFIWVEGEISNFKVPMSGHYYMVLKDEAAQIRAVMFLPKVRLLKFRPQDGMKVIAQGKIDVYSPRGEYQLVLDYLEPLGIGALALAFEQTKKKLAEEGLFDQEKKRPIPFLPRRVAVITSPTGAAIRDFLKIIQRRFANLEITVVPTRVQGEDAVWDLIEALEAVNKYLDVDVVVLTRGGGSLEDLWPFNREELAYAIRASKVPVVSAVGHEIDTTIADLAADLRAPTPSAAAEILVVEKEQVENKVKELHGRIFNAITSKIGQERMRFEQLLARVRDPRRAMGENWQRLDELMVRLERAMRQKINQAHQRLSAEERALMFASPQKRLQIVKEQLGVLTRSLVKGIMGLLGQKDSERAKVHGRLVALSPLRVLERGYSITRKVASGEILTHSMQVERGEEVEVILFKGELECRIQKVRPQGRFDPKALKV